MSWLKYDASTYVRFLYCIQDLPKAARPTSKAAQALLKAEQLDPKAKQSNLEVKRTNPQAEQSMPKPVYFNKDSAPSPR